VPVLGVPYCFDVFRYLSMHFDYLIESAVGLAIHWIDEVKCQWLKSGHLGEMCVRVVKD
jgi:hypothetical protein